jgi:hypothetical protein
METTMSEFNAFHSRESFESVIADRYVVLQSGALKFYNDGEPDEPVIVYAPGAWRTVDGSFDSKGES